MPNTSVIESDWSSPITITAGMAVVGDGAGELITTVTDPTYTTEFVTIFNNYVYYIVDSPVKVLKRFHIDTPSIIEVVTTTGMNIFCYAYSSSVIHNNKVYLIGGVGVPPAPFVAQEPMIRIIDLITFNVEYYSLKVIITELPSNMMPSVCIVNDHLYLGHCYGADGVPDNKIYKLNLTDKTYTTFITTSVNTDIHTTGVLCNFGDNFLYFIGGLDSTGEAFNNNIDCFDLTTGEKTTTPFTNSFAYIMHSYLINDEIYFGGSYSPTGPSNSIYKFNKQTLSVSTPFSMKYNNTNLNLYLTNTYLINGKFYVSDSMQSKHIFRFNFQSTCELYQVKINAPTITDVVQNIELDKLNLVPTSFVAVPNKETLQSTDIEYWLNSNPTQVFTLNIPTGNPLQVSSFKNHVMGEYSFRIKFNGTTTSSDWSTTYVENVPPVCEKVVLTTKANLVNFRDFEHIFFNRDVLLPDEYTSNILFNKIEDIFFYIKNILNLSLKQSVVVSAYRYNTNTYSGLCSNIPDEKVAITIDNKTYNFRYGRYGYTTPIEMPTFLNIPHIGHIGDSFNDDYVSSTILPLEMALQIAEYLRPIDPWNDDSYSAPLFQNFPHIYSKGALDLGSFIPGETTYLQNGVPVPYIDRDDYIDRRLSEIPSLIGKTSSVDGFVLVYRHIGGTSYSYANTWLIPFSVTEPVIENIDIDITSKKGTSLTIKNAKLGIDNVTITSPADLTRLTDENLLFTLTLSSYNNWWSEPLESVIVKLYFHNDKTRLINHKKFLVGEPLVIDFLNSIDIPLTYSYFLISVQYRSANYKSNWSSPIKIYPPLPSYVGKPETFYPITTDIKSCSADKQLNLRIKYDTPEKIKYGNLYNETLSYVQYQLANNIDFSTTIINVNNSTEKMKYLYSYATNFIPGSKRYIRFKKFFTNPTFSSDWSEVITVDQTLPETSYIEVETVKLATFNLEDYMSFKVAKGGDKIYITYPNHPSVYTGSAMQKIYLKDVDIVTNTFVSHTLTFTDPYKTYGVQFSQVYGGKLYCYVRTIADIRVYQTNPNDAVYGHELLVIDLSNLTMSSITIPFPMTWFLKFYLIEGNFYFITNKEVVGSDTSIWKMNLIDSSFIKITDCPSDINNVEYGEGTLSGNKIYIFNSTFSKIYEYDPINSPTVFIVILDLTQTYSLNDFYATTDSAPITSVSNGRLLKFKNNFYFLKSTPSNRKDSMNTQNYKFNSTHNYVTQVSEPYTNISGTVYVHMPFLQEYFNGFIPEEIDGYFYGVCMGESGVFHLLKKRYPGHL